MNKKGEVNAAWELMCLFPPLPLAAKSLITFYSPGGNPFYLSNNLSG